MATFFLLGNYTLDGVKGMSPDRTDKAVSLIRELNGEVRSMYALLGGYDFVLIVELPTIDAAMKTSLGLTLLTGISFKTLPAVTVDDFDRIIGEL